MMKFYKILSAVLYVSIAVMAIPSAYAGERPVTTDSRIRTYVYNENEVFHMVIHYGYQSSIEFAEGEELETISMGDSYSWKITPVGRRLFIKPLETNVRTNMTLITNKHTYQFDIIAKTPDDTLDEELVYVVRFFYPDKPLDSTNAAAAPMSGMPSSQPPMQPYVLQPSDMQPVAQPSSEPAASSSILSKWMTGK